MRNRIVLVAALVGVTLVIAISGCGSRSDPVLIIDESVAADFAAVAEEDWATFVEAFPAHRDCLGDVTLVADYALDDRAKYDKATKIMAIRVPGPRALLDRALIHELAHHVESVCPAHTEMRPAFLTALGRSEDAWFEGPEWGLVPSEIFAEAVVEYVLDERGRVHTDMGLIEQTAVDVVVDWATR